MDTTSLKRYLVPIWKHFCRKMRETRGSEGEGTVLPEAMMADETMKGFGTVEKLAEGYKTSSSKTFVDFMPDEAKTDPSVTKYKTGEDFYKGHKSLVEMIGKKGGIHMPADGASDEDMTKFYNSVGRPEKAEGYVFKPMEDLHPDLKITPEMDKAMKESLHSLGLSNKQANGMNDMYFTRISEEMFKQGETRVNTMKETQTALKALWGDKYVENSTLANRLVKVFGGDEAIKAFGDLGNNPGVLKLLANVGRKLSEDSITNPGGVDLLADAGQAKKRIADIDAKMKDMKTGSPGYDDLVKERTRLYTVLYPEGGGSA